jgi:phage baseplate assembly protein gpV
VFDYSDGLYLGGLLNGIPEQYIQFGSGGITIVSPTAITLNAPQINLQGPVTQTGGMMTSDTDVQAGSSNISLVMHKHTSESPGSPTSEPLP